MCRIIVLSLESLFVRSNRIFVSGITVLSLESLLVRSNRTSVCLITVLSLESLLRCGFIYSPVLKLKFLFLNNKLNDE